MPALIWKQVRVEESVHKRIDRLGSCGMSKSEVIESLIDFYDKNGNGNQKENKNKVNVLVSTKRSGENEDATRYIGHPI